MPHHFERVGSQITGCSNLYPLNASQSVSKIWLLVFTVSCFTVNKRAQKSRHDLFNCELVPSRNRARSGSQPFHTELPKEPKEFVSSAREP